MFFRISINGPRQRRAESHHMHSTLCVINIVSESIQILGKIVVVLHRHFYAVIANLFVDIKWRFVNFSIVFIQVFDILHDATLKMEFFRFIVQFAINVDGHPFRQISLLAQMLGNGVPIVVGHGFKNFWVSFPSNARAYPRSGTGFFDRINRLAPFIFLHPQEPVPADLRFHVLGEGIHHRSTDSVQTTGHFIPAAAEFTARV